MNAQKKLKEIEDKLNSEKNMQAEQEKKVHELELKATAEGLSLISQSEALTKKAHELEKMKASNEAIER